ncbi:hypothetical protein E2L06_17245 [Haloterrigena sp. H1]|uniref:hypothetical protein n=1 Tax=Haloterrigena sp. H1 TaxID=2552943 RepID=UPI00110D39CB|nr:hypothetical protein [Haloterrigena sp. H1]TMT81673.1 hypothetical protein E2L06_17245 [Haloterrigena sp. H1]
MTHIDDPDDAPSSDEKEGQMLARTWVIAANFRTPADYGIPTAPSLPAERRADGTLTFVDPDDLTPLLTVETPVSIRR